MTTPHMTDRIRILKHEAVPTCGSYEVHFPDGRPSRYFYWDDVPSRRLGRRSSPGQGIGARGAGQGAVKRHNAATAEYVGRAAMGLHTGPCNGGKSPSKIRYAKLVRRLR
jgi:hypothetical protein